MTATGKFNLLDRLLQESSKPDWSRVQKHLVSILNKPAKIFLNVFIFTLPIRIAGKLEYNSLKPGLLKLLSSKTSFVYKWYKNCAQTDQLTKMTLFVITEDSVKARMKQRQTGLWFQIPHATFGGPLLFLVSWVLWKPCIYFLACREFSATHCLYKVTSVTDFY